MKRSTFRYALAPLAVSAALLATPFINTASIYAQEATTSATAQFQLPPLTTSAEYQQLYDAAVKTLEGINQEYARDKIMIAINEQMPGFSVLNLMSEAAQRAYGQTDRLQVTDGGETYSYAYRIILLELLAGQNKPVPSANFSDWITVAKELPAYKNNETVYDLGALHVDEGLKVKDFVDNCQSIFDQAINNLRALIAVNSSSYTLETLNNMTLDELITIARTFPNYTFYGFARSYIDTGFIDYPMESVNLWHDYYYRGSAAELLADAQILNPNFHVEFGMTESEQALYDEAKSWFMSLDGGLKEAMANNGAERTAAMQRIVNAVNYQIAHFSDLDQMDFAAKWQVTGKALAMNEGELPSSWDEPRNIIVNQFAQANNIKYWSIRYQELSKLAFPELISLAKTLPAYINRDDTSIQVGGGLTDPQEMTFYDFVNRAEAVYKRGCQTLAAGLPKVGVKTSSLSQMTGEQLATILQSLPIYWRYGFVWMDEFQDRDHKAYTEGLAASYSQLVSYLKYGLLHDGMDNETVESSLRYAAESYARLIVAATRINPEFDVNYVASDDPTQPTQPLPSLPEAGTVGAEEESAMIIKLALGGIAATVTLAGLGLTAKRFLFSPLKRRR